MPGIVAGVPDFASSVERLLTQVHHWDEPRWRAVPANGTADLTAGTRAQLVHDLVQRLADLGAEAENRPSRPVPRVHDLVLRDQLRVLADDILAAGASADLLGRAAAAVDDIRHAL